MNLSRFSLMLLAIASITCEAQAATLSPETTKKVDALFQQWNKPDSPGCAMAIYQDGKIAYERGYGMADLNSDMPITPTTVFHVASMSKQFTAMSILLLAQQRKLSLDDDVHRYIPELPDYGQKITIANLLHHTSGLREQWSLLDLAGWRYSLDLISDDDIMSVIVKQKGLNFTPGKEFSYNNTGYTLLGQIVKRVSGMSLREFTTQNIFKPLGMTNTHFRDDHAEIIKHNAVGYEPAGKTYRISITNFDTVGPTSLHTTVEDLQRWDENFYHPRVGNAEVIKQMQQRGVLNDGEQIDYAAGLNISSYRGLPTVDHAGGDAGYHSDMTRFPKQHFSAAVLCNNAAVDPRDLVPRIADIILAKDFTQPVSGVAKQSTQSSDTTMSAPDMAAFVGTYWDREIDDFEKITLQDGKLIVDMGGGDLHPLKHVGDAHFHIADTPWGNKFDLHFVASAPNAPFHMEQRFADGKADTYEPLSAADLQPGALADYVGEYVSDGIEPIFRITVEGGKLTLSRLKYKPEELTFAMHDVYGGDIGRLRFTRDANARIVGFSLNGRGIRRLQFKRRAE